MRQLHDPRPRGGTWPHTQPRKPASRWSSTAAGAPTRNAQAPVPIPLGYARPTAWPWRRWRSSRCPPRRFHQSPVHGRRPRSCSRSSAAPPPSSWYRVSRRLKSNMTGKPSGVFLHLPPVNLFALDQRREPSKPEHARRLCSRVERFLVATNFRCIFVSIVSANAERRMADKCRSRMFPHSTVVVRFAKKYIVHRLTFSKHRPSPIRQLHRRERAAAGC